MKARIKTIGSWVCVIGLVFFFFNLFREEPLPRHNYVTFLEHLEQERLASVEILEDEFRVTLNTGEIYLSPGYVDEESLEKLSQQGVPIRWEHGSLLGWLIWPLVIIVLLGVGFIYLIRKGGTGAQVSKLKKSTARLIPESAVAAFSDVGGCTDAKEQLADVVDFLNNPKPWVRSGARLPHGVLLEGPPGCGKTLLARAVAGETKAKFYLLSASEFVELFVGVGAARVRDTFAMAAKNAPTVVFIDELDAVGRRRGSGIGSGHDEREQTLNQLLVCLDGIEPNQRVVVIAATNRPDILDQALLRKGRFDRRIRIAEPDLEDRVEMLSIHTRGKILAEDVSLEDLAGRSEGFTGADLESWVNEAALLAVRRFKREAGSVILRCHDFREALEQRSENNRFTQVDSVLIESATQLAEPTARARVRVILEEDESVEGDVLWADACFLKLRNQANGRETLVPKGRIRALETLAGTEAARSEDVSSDRWARIQPGAA